MRFCSTSTARSPTRRRISPRHSIACAGRAASSRFRSLGCARTRRTVRAGCSARGWASRRTIRSTRRCGTTFCVEYEAALCVETTLFTDVDVVLGAIEARTLAWGIVTNKATRYTLPLLESLGLAGRAGAVVCGDTTPFAKPHPAPLLAAAEQLGIDPLRCVYVGDAERDITAGVAAGMRTIVARYGYIEPRRRSGRRGRRTAWSPTRADAARLAARCARAMRHVTRLPGHAPAFTNSHSAGLPSRTPVTCTAWFAISGLTNATSTSSTPASAMPFACAIRSADFMPSIDVKPL